MSKRKTVTQSCWYQPAGLQSKRHRTAPIILMATTSSDECLMLLQETHWQLSKHIALLNKLSAMFFYTEPHKRDALGELYMIHLKWIRQLKKRKNRYYMLCEKHIDIFHSELLETLERLQQLWEKLLQLPQLQEEQQDMEQWMQYLV